MFFLGLVLVWLGFDDHKWFCNHEQMELSVCVCVCLVCMWFLFFFSTFHGYDSYFFFVVTLYVVKIHNPRWNNNWCDNHEIFFPFSIFFFFLATAIINGFMVNKLGWEDNFFSRKIIKWIKDSWRRNKKKKNTEIWSNYYHSQLSR